MCDCYETKCEHEGCSEIIPIHIGDYCVPRSVVHVFCERHTPKDDKTVKVFPGNGEKYWDSNTQSWRKSKAIGIKVDGMTANEIETNHIHPN